MSRRLVSRLYYSPAGESRENLDLMDKIDAHYTEHPTTGVLGMVNYLALTYGDISKETHHCPECGE